VNGATTTLSYNGGNQLTGPGNSYDASGNQIARQGGMTFAYNTKDQTSIITPPGSGAINMTYTGEGQAQRVAAGSATYTYNLLGLGTEGATTYTRDNEGMLTEERTAGGNYYYIFDGLGSIVALTDATGTMAATYSYDPYGLLIASTGTITNPWRFASGYLDVGTGLYKMGERYYDASLGRWMQPDRIAPAEVDPTTSNRYVYVGDDPVNSVDPDGQFAVAVVAEVGLGAICIPCAIVVGVVIVAVGVWWIATNVHFAKRDDKEHVSGKRKSQKDTHQKGRTRVKRDKRGEKGDRRRAY
jgi:RHS repeat-associated protein